MICPPLTQFLSGTNEIRINIYQTRDLHQHFKPDSSFNQKCYNYAFSMFSVSVNYDSLLSQFIKSPTLILYFIYRYKSLLMKWYNCLIYVWKFKGHDGDMKWAYLKKLKNVLKLSNLCNLLTLYVKNSRLFNVHIHVFSWTEFQLGENYSNYIWPL